VSSFTICFTICLRISQDFDGYSEHDDDDDDDDDDDEDPNVYDTNLDEPPCPGESH